MAFSVEALAAKPFIQKALAHPLKMYSVLSFFFGVDLPDDAKTMQQDAKSAVERMVPLWFAGGPTYDELCQPFAETIRKAGRRELGDWNDSVEGMVAQLILTDQLSRNVFRGTPEAFSFEEVSLDLARNIGAACQKDASSTKGEFYAPYLFFTVIGLMHSEDLSDQISCSRILEYSKSTFPELEESWNMQLGAAKEHRDVVERFGRYPHRNKLKNRESTPAEKAWLDDVDNLPKWAKSQG